MTLVKAQLLVGDQPVTVISLGEFPTTGEIKLLSAAKMSDSQIQHLQRRLSSSRQAERNPLCRSFGTANCAKFIAGPNESYNCATCKYADFATDMSCKDCEYFNHLNNTCAKNGYNCGTALTRSGPCQKLDWKLQHTIKDAKRKYHSVKELRL